MDFLDFKLFKSLNFVLHFHGLYCQNSLSLLNDISFFIYDFIDSSRHWRVDLIFELFFLVYNNTVVGLLFEMVICSVKEKEILSINNLNFFFDLLIVDLEIDQPIFTLHHFHFNLIFNILTNNFNLVLVAIW